MEKILRDILKELEFQTRLLQDVFNDKDKRQFEANQMQKQFKAHMDLLNLQMKDNPAVKMPPKIQSILRDMMKTIPGG